MLLDILVLPLDEQQRHCIVSRRPCIEMLSLLLYNTNRQFRMGLMIYTDLFTDPSGKDQHWGDTENIG
jgi:hypothetical protein